MRSIYPMEPELESTRYSPTIDTHTLSLKKKKKEGRGCTWVAQLVKCPTLDFGSGHDLRVVRSSPMSGSTLGMEPA